MPGATIQLKGSDSVGDITDFDGNFSISLPSNATTLVVSFIGYIDQEVDVTDTTNLTSLIVILSSDTEALEEVVVTGYGSVLKKDLTGSVSSVVIADEIRRTASTPDQLLQGRAAGVQVIQNSANPNSGVSVRIRGASSLRGNNEPLYVIDGVIISSAGEDVIPTGGGNTGQEAQSGLNGINPRDIERIEILKDASATAIYGSRGANGVVLITTKSGSKDEGSINVYATRTMRDITKTYDMLDGVGYADYQNAIQAAAGNPPRYAVQSGKVYSFVTNDNGEPTTNLEADANEVYDWQNTVYDTGISLSLIHI
mgnify:CR=1 FL=1